MSSILYKHFLRTINQRLESSVVDSDPDLLFWSGRRIRNNCTGYKYGSGSDLFDKKSVNLLLENPKNAGMSGRSTIIYTVLREN